MIRSALVPIFLALVTSSFGTTLPVSAQTGGPDCEAERPVALVPVDAARCAELGTIIRRPAALPLDEYEEALGDFLRSFCHRNEALGWKRDKSVRDTGPFTARLENGAWQGAYTGTHAPVVIWYSPEMLAWMDGNRPPEEHDAPDNPPPVPDGSVMVKEMFPAPAASCAGVDPTHLLPTSGAAVMVRDREASHDGWFWGWFGWSGWDPDWPAGPSNRLAYMGFGQYCVNCHASAKDNLTFANLKNVEGEPGEPLVFLSQHFYDAEPPEIHHRLVSLPTDDAPRLGEPHYPSNSAFTDAVRADNLPRRTWDTVGEIRMPSETYDNVWVSADGPTVANQFVTSDQCLGCHDAGSTGLQFDMTLPNPHGDNLLNLSPYATWRTSPMGLGGRDPIFFAQLASETETFHPKAAPIVQDVCLGCHGIQGQRQFHIDGVNPDADSNTDDANLEDDCEPFLRQYVNAAPWPHGNPQVDLAAYGALARDGISCTSCHHMLVGKGPEDPAMKEKQNRCLKQRQDYLNPQNKGFAKTFTGSFLVGPPDELYGPFEAPQVKPMEHALGITPVETAAIKSSEVCGSCHTVHLPVLVDGEPVDYTYEQTTYPEWAFSAFRTGSTPEGPLPGGPGELAESCQSCHMPNKDEDGNPNRSKIASIQEYSNFPQAEYNLGPEEIDLQVRDNFARHTLVGLNVFFVKMAQQFPDILGIRTQDPMLVSKGLDPLLYTEQKMLDQASNSTATVAVSEVSSGAGALKATVTVDSMVGHKFPSGVGFRRVFLEFSVMDVNGNALWTSGGTNGAGMIVDGDGNPLPGELWWKDDCSGLLHPNELVYQKHHEVIESQNQVQIYQELVTAPPPGVTDPDCGIDAKPSGPFTTSFLSICGHVKDNRILPKGFLPFAKRVEIAEAFGAGRDLAEDSGPHAVGDDPDYRRGGKDSLRYEIPLKEISGTPASVQATLYYQATPPYYLQDRFCTSQSDDTQRLHFLASHLNLQGTAAADWKLEVVGSGMVALE